MSLRDIISQKLKDAMKEGNKIAISTLRLVQSALKDKDIEARGQGKPALEENDVIAVLQKMVKQRQESASIYEKAGRDDLKNQEEGEIHILHPFLPQLLNEEQTLEVIKKAATTLNAQSIKDMGKVVSELKKNYPGQIDMSKASSMVKAFLER